MPVYHHFYITALEKCSNVMLHSETVSLFFSEQFVSLRSVSNFLPQIRAVPVRILCAGCALTVSLLAKEYIFQSFPFS